MITCGGRFDRNIHGSVNITSPAGTVIFTSMLVFNRRKLIQATKVNNENNAPCGKSHK